MNTLSNSFQLFIWFLQYCKKILLFLLFFLQTNDNHASSSCSVTKQCDNNLKIIGVAILVYRGLGLASLVRVQIVVELSLVMVL